MPEYSVGDMADLAKRLSDAGFSRHEVQFLSHWSDTQGLTLLRSFHMCLQGAAKIISPQIQTMPPLATITLGKWKSADECRTWFASIKCELNQGAELAIGGAVYATEETILDCVAVSSTDLGFDPDENRIDERPLLEQASAFGLLPLSAEMMLILVAQLHEQEYKEILRVLDPGPGVIQRSFVFAARRVHERAYPYVKSTRSNGGANYNKIKNVFIRPR